MMNEEITNRTFSLLLCDWIGFDLDHTLIRYRLNNLHQLIYSSMSEYLCQIHHYNPALLQINYDHSFAVKALIYDNAYGNLIQLDSQGFVHTALHGCHQPLTRKSIEDIYPNAFEAIEEDKTQRFLCIYTYFEHSISYLIATIVDFIDQEKIFDEKFPNSIDTDRRYSFFLTHLYDGFDYLFNDFHRGKYFSSIRSNPGEFIYQRNDVRQWLEKLRVKERKIFLATNSRFDYTDLLSSYAFGNDWKNLFDLILVDCKKPSFFTEINRKSFHRLMDDQTFSPVTMDQMFTDFSKNFIYSLGNSSDLHHLMCRISEKDVTVIYFGDHIKSDIYALKMHTNWLAAAVIEELEFDIPPMTIHTTAHHSSSTNSQIQYQTGQQSKYFCSFFTTPNNSFIFDNDPTNLDVVLPSLSSYWYAYITKHAHLSLSCLSVLANDFDFDHQFEHDQQTKHLILTNKKQQ